MHDAIISMKAPFTCKYTCVTSTYMNVYIHICYSYASHFLSMYMYLLQGPVLPSVAAHHKDEGRETSILCVVNAFIFIVGYRLMGIGRNEYIDMMNKYRSKVSVL